MIRALPETEPARQSRFRDHIRGLGGHPLVVAAAAALLIFLTALASIVVLEGTARQVLKATVDEHLLSIAELAAQRVDPLVHARLVRPEQISGPEYLRLVTGLRELVRSVPGIVSIYTVRSGPDGLRFVLDSALPIDGDGDGLIDQAQLGEVYHDPDAALRRVFATGLAAVGDRPYTDRWGTFLGAYVPIRNTVGGVEAVLGVDVHSEAYSARLGAMRRSLAGGILVAVILSVAVGIGAFSVQRSRRRGRLAEDRYRRELRLAQIRLTAAARSANVGLWEWNPMTDAIWWSDECSIFFGSPDDAPSTAGSAWRRMLQPPDAELLETSIAKHLAGEAPEVRFECRIADRQGRIRWIEVFGRIAEVDQQGQPIRLSGAIVDIESHKDTMRRLEESQQRIAMILETAAAGVTVYDTAGRLLECNREAERILGLTRAEIASRTIPDPRWPVLREDGGPFPQDQLPGVITLRTGRSCRDVSMGIRIPDGSTRWLHVNAEPLRSVPTDRSSEGDGAVEAVVISFAEVTAARAARRALEAAKEAAESANRSKSEFLANMSHEIRTPMTAILGFARLLERDPDTVGDPQRRHDAITTIRRNGEHLLAIINDILDFSKIEAGRMSIECVPVSPPEIAEDVVALLRTEGEARGLAVRCHVGDDVPAVIRSDPVRLRQILTNLLGNAIKFSECGEVVVELHRRPEHDATPPALEFVVVDRGIGIAPEVLARLFQPFSQADASTSRHYGGSGLGLAISRRLARLLGGDLTATSTPGVGSRFTLAVPIAPALDEVARTPRMDGDARVRSDDLSVRPLAGVRVLLADDRADNRRLIERILALAGADVRAVGDGRALLELLGVGEAGDRRTSPVQPPFDLLLLDMQMPGLDGYTIAARIAEAGIALPIIAVTAHVSPNDRAHTRAAGCADHVCKPIDAAELVRVCHRHATR